MPPDVFQALKMPPDDTWNQEARQRMTRHLLVNMAESGVGSSDKSTNNYFLKLHTYILKIIGNVKMIRKS